MDIVEITPERWPTVCAFIGDQAPQHVPAITLVAECDGKTLGVLLCERHTTGRYSGQVYVDSEHRSDPIASTLIDKATRKLQMRGVRCWRFDVIGGEEPAEADEPFWSALAWPTPPAYDDASDVTRVRGAA